MTPERAPGSDERDDPLADLAERKSAGLLRELWWMLRHSKRWWLTPIVVVLVLLGGLVLLSMTPAASFLYTLF